MTYGYDFYFDINSDVILFPITPGELIIKVGSNNKVVTLISEGDINILKSPTLTEVKFEARFPMRDYPYSRPDFDFTSFHEKLTELKEEKKSFRFIVARRTTGGSSTWDTNLLVALEDFKVTENADEGDDVLIEFNLKQFKEYGVKVVKNKTTNTVSKKRPTSKDTSKSTTYTVKSGDCLWNIAKAAYGDSTKWKTIYNANKSIIESTAEKYRGKGKGSSNGHWIYPGTKLTIPGVDDSTKLNVTKLK
jgi:LysM repeat protein